VEKTSTSFVGLATAEEFFSTVYSKFGAFDDMVWLLCDDMQNVVFLSWTHTFGA